MDEHNESGVSGIALSTLILTCHLIICAGTIQLWDPNAFGTFSDAFYFTFVSTATIGFGDAMPDDRFLLSVMIFLSFGMVVLSWFISAVHARVNEIF
jgi:hypothetical protein